MIYTHFPYLVSDSCIKQLETHGIIHTKEVIHIDLSFQDLPTKYAGESEHHRALKKVAFQMLKEMGEPNPLYEFNYYDVYSLKLRIIIECGDTSIDKILENLFRWGDADEVWALDYPDQNNLSELIKFKRSSYFPKLLKKR